ncbi:uncharacterized protein PRCAT00006365001 [Priceomyces carsonii]|uniref:uncharacterized protein n=1 Tax=Priceomyces carsonii TaxID=28549 RepID=UPI002ED8652C|nr:unnamed protein product [Priceomyces carsonii]
MKLTTLFLSIFTLISVSLCVPVDSNNEIQLAGRDSLDGLVYLQEKDFLPSVDQVGTSNIEKRDYAILTEFFTALNKTGLVPKLVKILATNKITEPLLVTGIVGFLKISNLDDLLTSVDKSGLTVDILVAALTNADFLPGAYEIINGLRTGATTTPSSSTLNIVSLTTDMTSVAKVYKLYSGLSSVFSEIGLSLKIGQSSSGIFSILNPILVAVGIKGGSTSAASSSLAKLGYSTTAASAQSTATGEATITSADITGTTDAAVTTGATKTSVTSTSASTTTLSASTSTSTSSSSSSTSLWDRIKSIFKKRDMKEIAKREVSIEKRDNEVLDNLVESLEKSGLAMSIVNLIILDDTMYPFARDLIKKIVTDKAITLNELSSALNSTNLLNDGIIDTLSSGRLGITF